MSTITKEFTKEQLQQIEAAAKEVLWPVVWSEKKAREHFSEKITPKVVLKLARIALASLEAEPAIHRWRRVTVEPYGPYPWHYGNFIGFSQPVDGIEDEYFYSVPPAPVSVPDEVCWEDVPEEITEDDMALASAWEHGFNQCRAAMLQGAEPVTTANKLPFEQWLSQQTGTIDVECGCVMTEVFFHWLRVAYEAGNSPVIPDGWVACSERMPDDDDFVYIWPRPDFGVELHVGQYCECHSKGDGWYAQVYEQNYGIEWCPITVTHWMPLPAAPQQEANP